MQAPKAVAQALILRHAVQLSLLSKAAVLCRHCVLRALVCYPTSVDTAAEGELPNLQLGGLKDIFLLTRYCRAVTMATSAHLRFSSEKTTLALLSAARLVSLATCLAAACDYPIERFCVKARPRTNSRKLLGWRRFEKTWDGVDRSFGAARFCSSQRDFAHTPKTSCPSVTDPSGKTWSRSKRR